MYKKRIEFIILLIFICILFSYLVIGLDEGIRISIDSTQHNDYGLEYPITYRFSIPLGTSGLVAYKKYSELEPWQQIIENYSNMTFNGVEAIRFNYSFNETYISIPFNYTSEEIYIKITNSTGDIENITFLEISTYYDNRTATVTIIGDDWTNEENRASYFQCASALFRKNNMWFSVGIITSYEGNPPNWIAIQEDIDLGFVEPLSHSKIHSGTAISDIDVGGSKKDIIDNLNIPTLNKKGSLEYVWGWIEPGGGSAAKQRLRLGEYKYLSDRDYSFDDSTFAKWDNSNKIFNRISSICNLDSGCANSTFDNVLASNGIYAISFHPTTCNFWQEGATRRGHIEYVGNRTNVWYAGFGQLYAYHYVQYMNLTNIERVNLSIIKTKSICPLNCDYTKLDDCLIDVNNTANSCYLNGSNQDYVFNKSYLNFNFSTPKNEYLINIVASNITIDFNGSNLIGSGNGTAIRSFSETINYNLTIKNVIVNNFSYAYDISGVNIYLINTTGQNSQKYNYLIGGNPSKNISLVDSLSLSGLSGGIYVEGNANETYIRNMNSSNNIGSDGNLKTHFDADFLDVRNSYFYNASGGDCIWLTSSNVTFVNNTIKDCLIDEKSGLLTKNFNNFYTITNNTFQNNNINAMFINLNNSKISNNLFNISYELNYLSTGKGMSIAFDGVLYSNFINNTIINSAETGLILTFTLGNLGGDTGASYNNITGNTFKNTTKDTYQYDLWVDERGNNNVLNNTLWLNNFYTTKPYDVGILTSYCYNNEGNFYNESIEKTTINETDCGLVNITQPDGLDKLISGSFNIQWRKQSSNKVINYSLYYKSINSSSWAFLASTLNTNYNWDVSGLNDTNDYLVKIVPRDDIMNGTNDNSTTTFTIDNTGPDVSLNPSVNTAIDLGTDKDISCSASDSLGIESISLSVDGSSIGTCGGGSCSGSYKLGDTNSKTVSCTATDNSGRVFSRNIILSYLGGSGGGGGGGSNGRENTKKGIGEKNISKEIISPEEKMININKSEITQEREIFELEKKKINIKNGFLLLILILLIIIFYLIYNNKKRIKRYFKNRIKI